jgi:hypothetical protein
MRKVRAFYAAPLTQQTSTSEWQPPQSLQWMPAGRHAIFPSNSEGKEIEVESSPEDAARLDAQLQEMLRRANAGEQSRPFIDFDHQGGAAAAIPKRIFWDDGIRMEVEWTGNGAASLRDRVYSYFSPEWYHGEDGHPQALPEVGPIGALVNTPAFQEIERLAAKKETTEGSTSSTKGNRMEQLLAILAGAKAIPSVKIDDTEAAVLTKAHLDGLARRVTELEAERDGLGEKLKASQGEIANRDKAEAESAVEVAIKAGRFEDKPEIRATLVKAYLGDRDGTKALLESAKATKKAAGATALEDGDDSTNPKHIAAEFAKLTDPVKRARFFKENREQLIRAAFTRN